MFVVAVFVFVSMARDILVGTMTGGSFARERRIVLCLIG